MTRARASSALGRIGPAFIAGACVIGPGSVTLMSKTGSLYGYSMLWLALLSGALMAGFIALFMRFGIYSDETFLGLTAKRLGRWYAVLCGVSLFSVDATFQFGNCLGVTAAMNTLFGSVPQMVWPIAFTAAAVAFLFASKSVYRLVEKMMVFFLIFMAVSFLVNVVWVRPDVGAVARGLCVPSIPRGIDWVTIGGLVATTFVIVIAFFQSYLVKAKGWREENLTSAAVDTVLASIMYTLIGMAIMTTAAAVLYPGKTVESATAMASQLEGVFGPYAKIVFCLGFFAAAFSSFITNSLIGGVLLNDGLGFGGRLDSLPTKVFATLVLLIGMTTAIAITRVKPEPTASSAATTAGGDNQRESVHARPKDGTDLVADRKVKAIAVGQAATLLAVPLGAIAMVVVLFDRRATKGRALAPWARAFVLLGAAVLLGIALMMFVKIKPRLLEVVGFS